MRMSIIMHRHINIHKYSDGLDLKSYDSNL